MAPVLRTQSRGCGIEPCGNAGETREQDYWVESKSTTLVPAERIEYNHCIGNPGPSL